MEDEEFTVADSRTWGVVSLGAGFLAALPFHGTKSTMVMVSVGLLIFVTRFYWRLRSRVWFWVLMVSIALAHAFLVSSVLVAEPKYPIIFLLYLIGFADFGIIVLLVTVCEKIFGPRDSNLEPTRQGRIRGSKRTAAHASDPCDP